MPTSWVFEPQAYHAYTRCDLHRIPQLQTLSDDVLMGIEAVSWVLPFRVNRYVVEQLIRWDNVPDDPIFQLTFPQEEMLEPEDFRTMRDLVRAGAPRAKLQAAARRIQRRLNPHPAGQMDLNVPTLDGERVEGLQHKYRETVLFFPSSGQTCHAYCTYCFRWAQFVGLQELRFANSEVKNLVAYLRAHPGVTDVLFTGGDPMVMRTKVLRRYVEPLLAEELPNLRSIRIGTKAPAYWPQRFVSDTDADDLLRLFEEVRAAGKHLALMAHYSHPRELETEVAETAVRRILSSGAVVRTQAPLIRHVNDDPSCWSRLWQRQVDLGAVPYYLFVERDTGPRGYFEVPLARALQIHRQASRNVSGLARTARGPSMSAMPGKVLVDGVAEIDGQRVFVLKLLQGRDPDWVNRVFFAHFDPEATWLDELRPALGEVEFFFEPMLQRLQNRPGLVAQVRDRGGRFVGHPAGKVHAAGASPFRPSPSLRPSLHRRPAISSRDARNASER